MLDNLRKLLAITYRATHQLKTYFEHMTSVETHSEELDINTLIQSLYTREDIPKAIIPLFFIIPKAFEDMSVDGVLNMISSLAFPLVEQLPWVIKSPDFHVQDLTVDEQEVSLYIDQYWIKAHQQPPGAVPGSADSMPLQSPSDDIFHSYMSTVIAYTVLDLMSVLVAEKYPYQLELSCRLARLSKICDLFLINKTVDLGFKHKHMVLGSVLDTLLHQDATDPQTDVPKLLKQLAISLKKISSYRTIKHCITVNNLDRCITSAKTFDDIQELLFNLISDHNKPLIDVWNYNSHLIKSIIRLIFNDNPIPQKSKTRLSLLLNGLKASDHQDPFARFNVLYYLHRKYVVIKDVNPYKESILSLMVNTFLDEDGDLSSPYGAYFMDYVLPGEHFGLALALCLSTVSSLNTKMKKDVFASLMQTADPSQGVALNWCKMMQNPKSTPIIEERFYTLFGFCIDEDCYKTGQLLYALLNGFNEILLQYDELLSQHPSLFIEDKSRSIIRMNRIADGYMKVINRSKNEQLTRVITATLSCHELTSRVILVSLLKAKPLAEIVLRLCTRVRARQLTHGDNVFYEADFIHKISHALTKLDLKNTSQPVLERLLSEENANLRAKLILMLLIVVTQKTKGPTIPKQTIWTNWVLSLVRTVLVTHKDSTIGVMMNQIISSCNIYSFLPPELRQKCLDLVDLKATIDQNPPTEEIAKELTKEPEKAKSLKHKKKNMTASSKPTVTPIRDDQCQPSAVLKQERNDSAGICSTPKLTSGMSLPKTKLDAEDPSASIDIAQTPFIKFHRALVASIEKINTLLHEMNGILLPQGFNQVFIKVQKSALSLQNALIPQSVTKTPDHAMAKSKNYLHLDKPAALDLEEAWNKELAEFSWDILRAMEKYVASVEDLERPLEHKAIISLVEAILASLSHCYFKNLRLHMAEDTIRCLEVIETYYHSKQVRLSIKGSGFAFPKKSGDLDLLLIPETPVEQMLIDDGFLALARKFRGTISPGPIFQTNDFFSQQVIIVLPNNHEIHIDLVFWKQALTPEQEVENTSRAVLSTCAVNWYLDGHACMQHKTARAICCDSPVLKVLVELKTTEDYMALAGYLLKNIIKYGDSVRHDQHIRKWLAEYVHPETRYAALPNSSQTNIENNQKTISEALAYLFNRFTSRTAESIHFIMDQKLLMIMLPMDKNSHDACATYFSRHFFGTDDSALPHNITGPAFLAMFYLGAFIDQTEEKREELIEGLTKSLVPSQTNINVTIKAAIRILALIPINTAAWTQVNIDYNIQKTSSKRLSFEIDALLFIFQMWHPSAPSPNTMRGASLSPIVMEIDSQRFFQGVVESNTAHSPPFVSSINLIDLSQ